MWGRLPWSLAIFKLILASIGFVLAVSINQQQRFLPPCPCCNKEAFSSSYCTGLKSRMTLSSKEVVHPKRSTVIHPQFDPVRKWMKDGCCVAGNVLVYACYLNKGAVGKHWLQQSTKQGLIWVVGKFIRN